MLMLSHLLGVVGLICGESLLVAASAIGLRTGLDLDNMGLALSSTRTTCTVDDD